MEHVSKTQETFILLMKRLRIPKDEALGYCMVLEDPEMEELIDWAWKGWDLKNGELPRTGQVNQKVVEILMRRPPEVEE